MSDYNGYVNFDIESIKASLDGESIIVPHSDSVEELDNWLMGLEFKEK